MNTFLLILLAFIIYCIYRLRKFINENIVQPQTRQQKKSSELEKDPKTGVYKPKK